MTDSLSFEFVRVLTIAGSDSGGGAGVQADLKTLAALGCFGMSAITALTAQNTRGVTAIHAVPAEFLRLQIDAVMTDIGAGAVKIGMLHAADIVRTVAQAIDRHQMRRVVLDPVMASATGANLIEDDAQSSLVGELFPRATLITPNLDEAAFLLGRSITTMEEMVPAAQALQRQGAHAVLLKGGHLKGENVADVLVQQSEAPRVFTAPRIATRNLHGAGCTLSSAVAAYLALGQTLAGAVELARKYVRMALDSSSNVVTGHGVGPLNHGFAPQGMRLRPIRPEPTK